jgi:D-alanine-D-alanine ligase
MIVAVVHTPASPCRCHESVLAALAGAGIEGRLIDGDSLPEGSDRLRGCRIAFDQTDTYRGGGDRYLVGEALRRAGLEVVGSSPEVSRVLDDKRQCKESLRRIGLPVPGAPGWPRIVKAAHEHGSRGTRLVRTPEEEAEALRAGEAIVEEFVAGREVAVGVIGRGRARVLPPVEIRIRGPIYTAEEKWSDDNPEVMRAEVPAEITGRLGDAYFRLGLRDMARFDLRVRPDGSWAVLEVNVRPSLEPVGLLAAAARLDGLDTPQLILGLLREAT